MVTAPWLPEVEGSRLLWEDAPDGAKVGLPPPSVPVYSDASFRGLRGRGTGRSG